MEKNRYKDLNLRLYIKRLILLIIIGILGHAIFLFYSLDEKIFQYFYKLNFLAILAILSIIFLYWVGHGFRMVIWSHYLKTPIAFRHCFRIAAITDLGAAISPTLIGGGPIKLISLIRRGLSSGKAGFMTILGGFEDFIMYMLALLASIIYARDGVSNIITSIFELMKENLTTITIFLLVFLIGRKSIQWFFPNTSIKIIPRRTRVLLRKVWMDIKKALSEMKSIAVQLIKDGKLRLIISFAILLIQWFLKFSMILIILLSFDQQIDIANIYLKQWITYLTMIFVPTPGAIGGAEGTFYLLFKNEISADLLPLIVSLWRFCTYYLFMFLAILLLIIGYLRDDLTV